MTMFPLPGSPALDAGNNALIPAGITTDQRGAPRVNRGTVDIGAVEAGPVTIVVSTLVDEGPAPIIDGTATSLREAIAFADADAYAGDTITFAPGLQGSLALAQGALPAITGDFAIAGPGANRLTIDAQGKAGILSITSGAVVTVFGLTLADGSADFGGGAIINHGSLALTGCTVSGNTAHDLGGGIDNYGTLR